MQFKVIKTRNEKQEKVTHYSIVDLTPWLAISISVVSVGFAAINNKKLTVMLVSILLFLHSGTFWK